MELIQIAKQPLFFRRNFSLFRRKIWVLDQHGNMVLFIKEKTFGLKEDVRVYSDDTMSREIILIKARRILYINAIYDVIDIQRSEKVGTFIRKGLKSIAREEWEIRDINGQTIGRIYEKLIGSALVIRRWTFLLIPRDLSFVVNNKKVAELKLKQGMNTKICKGDLTINQNGNFDPRIAVVGSILIMAKGSLRI